MLYFLFLDFTFLSFFPIIAVCLIFYVINKKKRESENSAKHSKDDLWHIIKEYLKMDNRHGLEVIDITLYPRPSLSEMNENIHKTEIYLTKAESKKQNIKYKQPIKQKKYEIETYFEQLEKTSNQNLKFGNINVKNRKRYVVCFRAKNKQTNKIYSWEAIEIEIFKNINNKNNTKFKISFNRKLDYFSELQWIYPMQDSYIKEKIAKQEAKIKKINKTLKEENIFLQAKNYIKCKIKN